MRITWIKSYWKSIEDATYNTPHVLDILGKECIAYLKFKTNLIKIFTYNNQINYTIAMKSQTPRLYGSFVSWSKNMLGLFRYDFLSILVPSKWSM